MYTIAARFLYGILLLLGFFFVFLMGKTTLPYLSFRYDVDFLLTKQNVLHLSAWRVAFYTHITSSLLVLLAGIIQLVKPVLVYYPRVHRQLGKMYVLLILLVSAPSGLVMAVYANGGFWAKISFVLISLLWWYFTWVAFRKAVQGDFTRHKQFMYRSFALTLSAITLRTYVWVLPLFAHWHGLHGREMYVWVAWLSWVPNLFFVELVLFWRNRVVRG
ncbi:DUF2306 domain-containing protein [Sabulibacter ruber]|uniref:DUF2306 domain-containing protein n=1 Tax=Sabulibacter ruber TaxID=2811901 RepID=UPI001A9630BF|nr:DUF2306 domain-containing protein [Sabulibacter ruber]